MKWWVIPSVVAGVGALAYGGVGVHQTLDIGNTLEGVRGSVLVSVLNEETAKKSADGDFAFLHSDDYYQDESYNSWRASYMLTDSVGDGRFTTEEIQDVKPDYVDQSRTVANFYPWLKDDVEELAQYSDQEEVNLDTARDAFTAYEIEAGCDARIAEAEGDEGAEDRFFDASNAKYAPQEDGNADVATVRWTSVLYGMDKVCPENAVTDVKSKDTSK